MKIQGVSWRILRDVIIQMRVADIQEAAVGWAVERLDRQAE